MLRNLHGQNLITNGNFENTHSDTVNLSIVYNATSNPGSSLVSIQVCTYWGKYSNCGHFSYTKPADENNFIDHNMFAEILTCAMPGYRNVLPQREYLQGKLCKPLAKDSVYVIQCRIRIFGSNKTNQLHVYFSDTLFDVNHIQYISGLPSILNKGEFLSSEEWVDKRITYKTHGGEQYVVFANFHDDKQTQIKKVNNNKKAISSVLIDDIFIYPDGTDKNKSACENTAY